MATAIGWYNGSWHMGRLILPGQKEAIDSAYVSVLLVRDSVDDRVDAGAQVDECIGQ